MSRPALQNPSVPFTVDLNGMFPGKVIQIKGQTHRDAKNFVVNLLAGSSYENGDNVAFHFSVRFDENVVVRNSRIDGKWQQEEREGGMPFKAGDTFQLLITCAPNHYEVKVDWKDFTRFSHRIPAYEVSHLFIVGDVKIRHVGFQIEGPFAQPTSSHSPANGPVAVPFPSLKHHKVVFVGQPTQNAGGFAMNLVAGGDIALHISPRFNENAIVRNSFINGKWGQEERGLDREFPFARNSPFLVQVDVTQQAFHVRLNGVHLFDFKHRIRPLKKIRSVEFKADVEAHHIAFF